MLFKSQITLLKSLLYETDSSNITEKKNIKKKINSKDLKKS